MAILRILAFTLSKNWAMGRIGQRSDISAFHFNEIPLAALLRTVLLVVVEEKGEAEAEYASFKICPWIPSHWELVRGVPLDQVGLFVAISAYRAGWKWNWILRLDYKRFLLHLLQNTLKALPAKDATLEIPACTFFPAISAQMSDMEVKKPCWRPILLA